VAAVKPVYLFEHCIGRVMVDGCLTSLWVRRPLSVNQQGQLSLPSLSGWQADWVTKGIIVVFRRSVNYSETSRRGSFVPIVQLHTGMYFS